jgi:hypothetical protein
MKRGLWFAIGGVLTIVAVIVALNLFLFNGTSVAAYIDKKYDRNTSLEHDRETRVYTSGKPPSRVTDEIVDAWRPISQHTDASGVYLRYSDDAVVVQPRGSGSVIRVLDVDRAYRHYYGHVGGVWGWTSTHGGSFRGGGPGAGK